jgi:hypothetical protein
MDLDEYIKNVRKCSMAEFARDCGLSRERVRQLCDDGGRVTSKTGSQIRIASDGNVTEIDLLLKAKRIEANK